VCCLPIYTILGKLLFFGTLLASQIVFQGNRQQMFT
jgi:hypothetical protein